ncbi:hypothetical protein BDV95DRAFT_607212 [Massariosphaeria phaeospora]|uniref:Aminoglycoside phosphotransferase domain-containing protein n=1 Tax=Massariosphaeria phaeospora TaxID=100035 RepID=A0A7C8MB33_9PLEO|nr:hypothetical protein BDV95DRAFT_607212 [Massariosphaeria phaeospora]
MKVRQLKEVIMEHFGTTNWSEFSSRFWRDSDKIPDFHGQPDHQLKFKLPYYASEHPLIPSIEEINRVMDENPMHPFNWDIYGNPSGMRRHNVCRIGPCLIKRDGVKQSALVHEVENMLYLQEHSKVRTAKVYAFFSDSKRYYLVTEFLEGKMLLDGFEPLDKPTRDIISSKLAEQLQLLRATPSPGYYGRVNGQPFDPMFPGMETNFRNFYGLFYHYDDLLTAMYRGAEVRMALCTRDNYLEEQVKFLTDFKPILGATKDPKPVLTFRDIKRANMLLNSVRDSSGNIVDWTVTLVDWHMLEWLPGWAQAVCIEWHYAQSKKPNILHHMKILLESLGDDSTKECDFLFDGGRVGYYIC